MNLQQTTTATICGIFYLGLTCSLFGCVSVNLPTSKYKKAEDVKFQAPTAPYKEISNPGVDFAWQNAINGNTLAFLSECDVPADSTLKSMETESLSSLSNLEIIESKETLYNERKALKTTAVGQVDGVQVKIALVIFKRNNCDYTMSYVGRAKFFDEDISVFKNFKEGFKAP